MTEAGGMAKGIMGHPTCLPSPLLGTVLLAEDAVMLEQELGLPRLPLWSMQGRDILQRISWRF